MAGKRSESWESLYADLDAVLSEDLTQPDEAKKLRDKLWEGLEKFEKSGRLTNVQVFWLQHLVDGAYRLGRVVERAETAT